MLRPGVRLIHIRHGLTDWNAEGRLQGQTDIPINDVGRGQASGNGERLAAFLAEEGVDPASLGYVCSPLGRTRETMAIVRDRLGLAGEAATDDRLKEVGFGAWSGFTYAELRAGGNERAVRRRKDDKWSFRPPEGESYADLSARVGEWLETIETDTVAVAHGGVYRVLQGLILGVPLHEVPSLPAPQDRIALFQDGLLKLF
ncbi:histidine phosphatase family protein [Acuticoccus mangrovi]|uniref:Histidine phosphatase family protein n=1 Tax=Acuticoccus mangrovi TaxID=2796142 RepID=A0A934IKF7_9HYPH|nr:histidine phosphatase family protein [Acuticoccus mangrovi]MBJ3778294.1 histidine phosphatase family protein [Acuticoccus mangrovi]